MYFDLSTELGSTFRLKKLNHSDSGGLLSDMLERETENVDVNCRSSASSREIPEESIAEAFSRQEFLNNLSTLSVKLASVASYLLQNVPTNSSPF